MRILSTLALCISIASLNACGGGSGPDLPQQMALLSGKIASVDGASGDLSGIVIESKSDGRFVETGPDGRFSIPVPAGEDIVLHFEDPDHPEQEHEDDVSEKDDVSHDGADIDGDEVTLDALDHDEACEIEVHLENGEVKECRVEHPDRKDAEDDRPEFEAECRLEAVDGSSEPEAVAEAELVCERDCCFLEVEAGGVLFSDFLTVVVECEDAREELGRIVIVERGGHFEMESCLESDEPLPFGVESLHDLAGCRLLLLDPDGEVALEGCVPGRREEEDGHDEDGDDVFKEDAHLEPVDGSSEPEAEGGVLVVCEGDCCSIVVEVGGVFSSEVLTVVVSCEGLRVEIGRMEINEHAGRFAAEYCGDTPRPFEVESLRQLHGCELLILDGSGDVALAGAFPGQPEED